MKDRLLGHLGGAGISRQEAYLKEWNPFEVDLKANFNGAAAAVSDGLPRRTKEGTLDGEAVAGGLPFVTTKEVSNCPETLCPLIFQIPAALIQIQSSHLRGCAGPSELFCSAAARYCQILSVEAELAVPEAADFRQMGGDRVFEMGIWGIIQVRGLLNRIHFIEEAQEAAPHRR